MEGLLDRGESFGVVVIIIGRSLLPWIIASSACVGIVACLHPQGHGDNRSFGVGWLDCWLQSIRMSQENGLELDYLGLLRVREMRKRVVGQEVHSRKAEAF